MFPETTKFFRPCQTALIKQQLFINAIWPGPNVCRRRRQKLLTYSYLCSISCQLLQIQLKVNCTPTPLPLNALSIEILNATDTYLSKNWSHWAAISRWKFYDAKCSLRIVQLTDGRTEEEEEEVYLAQTQQIKCKYKSYTIQLSRVTGKLEGQLCRPP